MKKTTSAFISGFSAVLLCALIGPFMLTACKGGGETQPDASATTAILDTFPAQLTDSADLAFTATCENGGPFDWGYDYWTKRRTMPEINKIVKDIEKIVARNKGLSTEVLDNFNNATINVGKAAKSMQNLTDYLERHPEALIKGKK